jgi:hypothetical protein
MQKISTAQPKHEAQLGFSNLAELRGKRTSKKAASLSQ